MVRLWPSRRPTRTRRPEDCISMAWRQNDGPRSAFIPARVRWAGRVPLRPQALTAPLTAIPRLRGAAPSALGAGG